MEDRINEYEEISFREIFGVIHKNIPFIISFVIVGLLVGGIISGLRIMQNPVQYRYQAKATIELVNSHGRTNQDQAVLNVLRSTAIFENAARDLEINASDYKLDVSNSIIPDQYDVIIEGPDEKQAVRLVNQVVSRTYYITSNAIFMTRNNIVENGHIPGEPIEVSKNVNIILIVGATTVFAGILSIFLIFFIRYMDGKVHSQKDVEKLLKTKVLASIPIDDRTSKIKKFISVR